MRVADVCRVVGATGRLLWVADVGRVVEVQLDVRCG